MLAEAIQNYAMNTNCLRPKQVFLIPYFSFSFELRG